VTGAGKPATLSTFKAANTATFVKAADANGGIALDVALPSDASGSYAVTGTDGTTIGTATLTVTAVDAGTGTGLAHTGYEAPLLLIWGAAGALMLGIALVVVLSIVRRQRANA
jgi:hypothetical protein